MSHVYDFSFEDTPTAPVTEPDAIVLRGSKKRLLQDIERIVDTRTQAQGGHISYVPLTGLIINGRFDASRIPVNAGALASVDFSGQQLVLMPASSSASSMVYVGIGAGTASRINTATTGPWLDWSNTIVCERTIVPSTISLDADPLIKELTLYSSLAADFVACVSSDNDSDGDAAFHDPLAGYEVYDRPNWDGYDAEPIAAETLSAARYFLTLLPGTLGEPDIAPGGDGTIGLEWSFADRTLRKLFIDVGPGAVWGGYWRRSSGEKRTIPPSPIDADTKRVLKELFEKLSS